MYGQKMRKTMQNTVIPYKDIILHKLTKEMVGVFIHSIPSLEEWETVDIIQKE